MALFGTKSKTTKKSVNAATSRLPKDERGMLAEALTAPWFSEKALIGTEKGVYVFAVPEMATKEDVALAVESLYKVAPKAVRIVNLPGKTVSLRRRRGTATRAARRKAYVSLKAGDSIQFA